MSSGTRSAARNALRDALAACCLMSAGAMDRLAIVLALGGFGALPIAGGSEAIMPARGTGAQDRGMQ
jgi:hypothetical protein